MALGGRSRNRGVGRAGELATAAFARDTARAGMGSALSVTGPAGSGKTWLCESIAEAATDEGFRVGVSETQSRKYLIVSTGDHVTSEVYLLPADNPAAPMLCVSPRKTGRDQGCSAGHVGRRRRRHNRGTTAAQRPPGASRRCRGDVAPSPV